MIPVITTSKIGKIRANSTIGPADSPRRNRKTSPDLVRRKQRMGVYDGEERFMVLAPRSKDPKRDRYSVRHALTTIRWLQLQQPRRTQRVTERNRSALDSPVSHDPHKTEHTTSESDP